MIQAPFLKEHSIKPTNPFAFVLYAVFTPTRNEEDLSTLGSNKEHTDTRNNTSVEAQ